MSWWDSYRAVYGAELRAAAREYVDHGWPLVPGPGAEVLLSTGEALDVVEVPEAVGRRVCRTLRDAGEVVPVAATPEGTFWFPMTPRHALPAELSLHADVVLHTDGIGVVAPPSSRPDGWVQWRVSPARIGYRIPDAAVVVEAVREAVEHRAAEAVGSTGKGAAGGAEQAGRSLGLADFGARALRR
ncbi:bifunctional DNA primase/polymerase [Pseudonocardia phyllosphaerae]|uniref:bifunctional DNA primase/polymerase n=1 Tax=Pseudonocardia phyllosphaerae TaxID=3390502 RepID=UPI00397C4352